MNKDLIISKYKELVKLYKDYSKLYIRPSASAEEWNNMSDTRSAIESLESDLSLLQEQGEKTPVEQIREAFEPIQMGANMVYANPNNYIPITPSGKELREELIKFADWTFTNALQVNYDSIQLGAYVDKYLKSNQ